MQEQTIILMGRSGCGKGTQVKLLMDYIREHDSEKREIFHLETGATFREFIAENTYTSKLSKAIYDAGTLQPSFLAVHIWSHVFIENLKGGEHIILDGTPRTFAEVPVLDTAFRFYGRTKPKVIVLDVGNAWSTDRMKERGRFDEKNPDDMKKRLEWFDTDVVPAIRYMEAQKLYDVHHVNGEQSIEKVHADIIAAIF